MVTTTANEAIGSTTATLIPGQAILTGSASVSAQSGGGASSQPELGAQHITFEIHSGMRVARVARRIAVEGPWLNGSSRGGPVRVEHESCHVELLDGTSFEVNRAETAWIETNQYRERAVEGV